MQRLLPVILVSFITACASQPPLPPYRAEALASSLTGTCPAAAPADGEAVPEGLAFVRSEGADMLVVAAGRCVLTISLATGQAETLPLRGELATPTMVDATAEGVALSSRAAGTTLRISLGETTTTETLSGFQGPQGIRLLPGGSILLAEFAPGRVIRVGPSEDSRPVTVIDRLQGPVGLVFADATTAYVTERTAGRITRFAFRSGERQTVIEGLDQPEGIALLADRRLVVAETGQRRVLAVDPETGNQEVLADNLPIGGATTPDAITDVTVASDGTIYVTSDFERTVLKLTRRP